MLKKAYRLVANLGLSSSTPNFNFNLAIMPGVEKHFEGTISLKVGNDLINNAGVSIEVKP